MDHYIFYTCGIHTTSSIAELWGICATTMAVIQCFNDILLRLFSTRIVKCERVLLVVGISVILTWILLMISLFYEMYCGSGIWFSLLFSCILIENESVSGKISVINWLFSQKHLYWPAVLFFHFLLISRNSFKSIILKIIRHKIINFSFKIE